MSRIFPSLRLPILLAGALLLASCAAEQATSPSPAATLKVAVMIDSGSENDKSFNELSLRGAREAAEEVGFEFKYTTPQSATDYADTLEQMIVADAPDLVITVGFRMAEATSRAARAHPDVWFAIVDNEYLPGFGCPESAEDCYVDGGLTTVTSLMFAEDEVSYLAGVLAGCMTETGTVATVAGVEIPPVVRLHTGFESGARAARPDVVTLHLYIPDFNDPDTGKAVAQGFISEGADVIFGAAGNTGNGGLLAAKEAGVMAVGVDVDQYLTYPEVGDVLLTSAAKNMDVAVATAVRDYAAGRLEAGIRRATLETGGIGLAPYHEWEDRIPGACKDMVTEAEAAVKADPTITGAK
jgi:basic membrane protein A and related proteins